jgi:phospholipid/cholesterol/gamma-HCH transport system substrate-binding protein
MPTDARKFQIGLFVVLGISLAVAAVIGLGASHFFSDTRNFVTYFNESVQGLEKDSLVKFRGIPVGRVYWLGIAPDGKLAEVVLKIDDNVEISSDMRIKMAYAGITGMKYLEIDRIDPGSPDRSPALDFRPPYPVILSVPSDLQEILASVEQVVANLKDLDLKGIGDRLKSSMDDLRSILAKDNWTQTIKNIQAMSTSLRTASRSIEEMLQKPGVENLLSDASRTVASLKELSSRLEQDLNKLDLGNRVAVTTDKIDRFLGQATLSAEDLHFILSQQEGNIFQIMDNLRMASESLNNLAAALKANPAQTLFTAPAESEK